MTNEERHPIYFRAFLANNDGRQALADIREGIYGEEVNTADAALCKLARIELLEGILKNCGVTDEAMVSAFETVAVELQEKKQEDSSMYGDK